MFPAFFHTSSEASYQAACWCRRVRGCRQGLTYRRMAGEGPPLMRRPSADAVAGNGAPLNWRPSADAVAGGTWAHACRAVIERVLRGNAMLSLRVVWQQWMRRGRLTLAAVAGGMTLMTGCVVGPDYVRPTVITPAAYKEVDGWKVAQPHDHVLRGAWWGIFGDPQLNALEAQVSISNQNLAQAEATYRQARALVREAHASYFPTLTLGLGYTRSRNA